MQHFESSSRFFISSSTSSLRGSTPIGSGVFGEVFKNGCLALKKFGRTELNYYVSEIAILRRCNHPNIIEIFRAEVNKLSLYIVMPLAIGDLKSTQLNSKQKNEFPKQILRAVDYIHSRNIAHCDIKPENILLMDEDRVVLCDFGLSIDSSYFAGTEVVTLWYRPLELLLEDELLAKDCYKKADIWALGCTLYRIITGDNLFDGETVLDQIFKIFRKFGTPYDIRWKRCKNYKSNFPKWDKDDSWILKLENYSSDLKNLVVSSLTLDPDLRPNSTKLLYMCGETCSRTVGHRIIYPPVKKSQHREMTQCWLFEVVLEYSLNFRCLSLACYIYDCYKPTKNYQTCILASFYIACCYILQGPMPRLSELSHMSDDSIEEKEIQMEVYDICQELEYDFQITTTYDLIRDHTDYSILAEIIMVWIDCIDPPIDPQLRVKEMISMLRDNNQEIILKYEKAIKLLSSLKSHVHSNILELYAVDIPSVINNILSSHNTS